jgi:outer membrane protein assembly factor BamB
VEKPVHGWGYSASPVLADGKLILHIGSIVHALDPETGETLWRVGSSSNWGTPLPVSIGKEKAIVTTGGDILAARDGKYLARGIASLPWTSPVAGKGVLYVVDEAGAVAYRLPWEFTEPLKLDRLWTARPPADRYYASPVVHEGLVYAVTQGGTLSVLDAGSGAIVYSRHIPLGGTFYPSICLAGNRIFVSSDSGRTVVLEPGREYREVGSNTLEPFRSTPVFSGSRMYVRTMSHLFCIGK